MKHNQDWYCLANRRFFAVRNQKPKKKCHSKSIYQTNYMRYINSMPRMRRRGEQ